MNEFGPGPDLLERSTLLSEFNRIAVHDHLCFFYDNLPEWQACVAEYVKNGLERGEKCCYIHDTHTARQVRDALKGGGIKLSEAETSGQLKIIHGHKAYLKNGVFSSQYIIEFLISQTKAALAQGYSALRVTGETAWIIQRVPGWENILEYEARINREISFLYPCTIMCQYEYSRFEDDLISSILITHPKVIKNNQVLANTYFVANATVFNQAPTEKHAQFLLNNIVREDKRERTLSNISQNLQIFFRNSPSTVLITDEAGHYLDANQAALNYLECSREELLQKTIWDTCPPRFLAQKRQQWAQKQSHNNIEVEYLVKGRIKTMVFNLIPFFSQDKYLIYGIGQDITDNKKTLLELKQSEEKFRRLYLSMNEGMVVHQMIYDDAGKAVDYIIIDVNPAYESITGLKCEQIRNQKSVDIYHTPEPPFFEIYQKVVESGEPAILETYFEPIQKYLKLSVFSYQKGSFATVFTDISENTQLAEKNNHLATMVESSNDAIIGINQYGIITSWNSGATCNFGYAADEMIGQPFSILAPSGLNRMLPQFIQNLKNGVSTQHASGICLKKDQTQIFVDVAVSPLRDNEGRFTGAVSIARDISDRIRMENSLKASEEKYRLLFENANEGVFVVQDERIKLFNPKLQAIIGYNDAELADFRFFDFVYSGDRQTIENNYHKRIKGEMPPSTYAFRVQRKDAQIRWVELNVVLISWEGKPATLNLIEDITERQQTAEQINYNKSRLEELYSEEKSQRLELEEESKARGMFVDILAHELRTPLTPVLASISMLEDLLKAGPPDIQQKLVSNALNGAETLRLRLEELLDLAKCSRGTFSLNRQPANVNLLLETIVDHYQPAIDRLQQVLTLDIQPAMPIINLDSFRLEQVITNLLSNACKFNRPQGTIRLTAAIVNQTLLVEVKDEGIGIPLSSQSRLFQPYHRVEQDRQNIPGIGLGLAICKQIVEAHGGKIWLTSQAGQGSTFSFTIPALPPDFE
jgi:PAS domain S-box-containing protein